MKPILALVPSAFLPFAMRRAKAARLMLAALPMYDLDELRPATDELWTAVANRLAARGVQAPLALTRGADLHSLWTDPRLLLAQTCGYPLVTSLRHRVTLVATPCYQAPGCEHTAYRSALIVRRSDPAGEIADLRGRRCALNSLDSNSGMNLLRHAVLPLTAPRARFFSAAIITGSHADSIRAVASGQADVAAIDCVTWAHLQRLRPAETAPVRVLGWTQASPGLPLITARGTSDDILAALRAALDEVACDPALAAMRAALLLNGFAATVPADYEPIAAMERQAAAQGNILLA